MRKKLIVQCLLVISSCIHLVAAAEDMDLIQNEDFIPFYAVVEEPVETDIGLLDTGLRVVVIRPVDSKHVVVDVPRKGITTLSAGVTNLAEEITKLRDNKDPNIKIVPRMSFFLANRIASGESGWLDVIRGDRINKFTRWILLYGDASVDSMPSVIEAASQSYNRLSEAERAVTLFVYMDVAGVKKSILQLAEQTQPSIHCMPGYLSRAYVRSFNHVDAESELPRIVEVASSGRILDQAVGFAAVNEWLQENL